MIKRSQKIFLAAACLAVLAQVFPAVASERLPAHCQYLLIQAKDADNNLDFAAAEVLGQKAVDLCPHAIFPRLVLEGIMLSLLREEIKQSGMNKETLRRFYSINKKDLEVAETRHASKPGVDSRLLLGGCIGARGMAELLEGRYWDSYQDGTRGVALLREALVLDPGSTDANLGLGEFEYTCGRLAGILQWLLDLHGDKAKGIEMLKTCARGGGWASFNCTIALARLYCDWEKNYAASWPFALEAYQCYPKNHSNVACVLKNAGELGLEATGTANAVEQICGQWDSGWRPPCYAPLNLEPVRMKLAQRLLKTGRRSKALFHLEILAKSPDAFMARKARELLGPSIR